MVTSLLSSLTVSVEGKVHQVVRKETEVCQMQLAEGSGAV